MDPWPASALDKNKSNGRGSEWQAARCNLAQCGQVEGSPAVVVLSAQSWPILANHCRVLLQLTCRCRKPCSGPGDGCTTPSFGAALCLASLTQDRATGVRADTTVAMRARPTRLDCSRGINILSQPSRISPVSRRDNARLPGPTSPTPDVNGAAPCLPTKRRVSVGSLAWIRPLLPRAGSPRGLVAVQENCETELSPDSFGATEHDRPALDLGALPWLGRATWKMRQPSPWVTRRDDTA